MHLTLDQVKRLKGKDGIRTWPYRFLKGYLRDLKRYAMNKQQQWKQHFHRQVPINIMKAVLAGKKNVRILVLQYLSEEQSSFQSHTLSSSIGVTDNEDDDVSDYSKGCKDDTKMKDPSSTWLPCFTCFLQLVDNADVNYPLPLICESTM